MQFSSLDDATFAELQKKLDQARTLHIEVADVLAAHCLLRRDSTPEFPLPGPHAWLALAAEALANAGTQPLRAVLRKVAKLARVDRAKTP
jgi:hypothetical protein